MFNNDSNTSLVMVGGPYPYPSAVNTKQPASMNMSPGYNQLVDPRLAPHPQAGYYFQQPRTIEIIQLEEVPPPSKREHISVPGSSSWASSSSYASSSAYTSSEEDGEEEEEEAASESYCSSEEEEQQMKEEEEDDECEEVDDAEAALGSGSRRGSGATDSYSARMRRIEQWRDSYAKAVGAQLGTSLCLRLTLAFSLTSSQRRHPAEQQNERAQTTRRRTIM